MNDLLLNLYVKHIHRRSRKLSRTNTSLKQQIQLCKRPSCRFRQTEIDIDDAEEAGTSPEEAGIVAPVPGRRIEHIRRENAADYTDNVASDC